MEYMTKEFRLVHMDSMIEKARFENCESMYEVREVVRDYLDELEEEASQLNDFFLKNALYDILQDIDISNIEDDICDILDISLDTW